MSLNSAPAFSLRSRIEEFEQFQDFCLSYEHGIRYKHRDTSPYSGEGEKDYQPRRATTFIYAFFVFNDIYKINWAESLKNPDDEPSEWKEGLSQQEMFWAMTAFCFSDTPNDVRPFTTRLFKYCKKLGVHNPSSELKKISEADNTYLTDKLTNQYDARQKKAQEISLRSIGDFLISFDALYQNGASEQKTPLQNGLTHINNVLYFIYLVRCSVFHGRKQLTVASLGRDQDVRLAIYAATIMAMNQVVIEQSR
jgi:hypothetical protein